MFEAEKYFHAEKNFCLFGLVFGLLSLSLAAYFLFRLKQPFYSGISYPFVLLGLFFLIVCGIVFFRSPGDLSRVNHMLGDARELISSQEIPRMQKVMSNFRFIILVEIALLLVSLIFLFFIPVSSLIKGIFCGLLIQASFLLIFDVLAQQRGKVYLEFLYTLII